MSYIINVYTDPTGLERRAGIMQQLQRRQNEAIMICMRIGREEHVGSETLLAKSGMPSINELSVRSNSMMDWRTFAENGDLLDLAAPRLRLQAHVHKTRSATSGKLVQDTKYYGFIKKGAIMIFNCMSEEIKNGSKSVA
jgi:hypothetical protein